MPHPYASLSLPPRDLPVLELRRPGPVARVILLAEPDGTPGTGLDVGLELLDPGARVPEHRHAQEELLFFHAGAGWVTLGEERFRVEAGASVHVAPGVWHSIENPGPERLELLWVIQPAGLSGFFREIGASAGSGASLLSADEIAAAAARHGMELR